jgi:putative membrane protein
MKPVTWLIICDQPIQSVQPQEGSEMKGFNRRFAASVLALFVLALSAWAEDKKLIEKKPAGKEPATDQEFVVRALACDLAEIKLAEKAIKQTSNKDVERFARRMRDDHTKDRDALLERAREMKVGVLGGLDKEHQEKADRLAKLEGSEYDRAYMRCMVENHEKALRLYETWAEKAKDRELAAHLKRTIPTLKEHLEQAREISNKLKS